VFSGVFVGAVVDGAEDKGSGDTTTFDVHTLLEAWIIRQQNKEVLLCTVKYL